MSELGTTLSAIGIAEDGILHSDRREDLKAYK
jgi:hypothetical protein